MIDIFNPLVSKITKSLEGKTMLVYGTNRTGKTFNCVKAEKPLVLALEDGLHGLNGVPYVRIQTWRDWMDSIKAPTSAATLEKARATYQTIIVDSIDGMEILAKDFICQLQGVNSLQDGKYGSAWAAYSEQLTKWIKTLTNSGYTVIFIGHDGTREQLDEKGATYNQIYPKGDKRVVDIVCSLVDIIAYAQPQSMSENGTKINSTLYLTGTKAFHAGTRFDGIVPMIAEWDMKKLETAIADYVALQEKGGVKTVSYEESKKEIEDAAKSKWASTPIAELVNTCVEKAGALIEKNGGDPSKYQDLLFREFNTRDFKVSKCNEQQRPQVEQLLDALIAEGV